MFATYFYNFRVVEFRLGDFYHSFKKLYRSEVGPRAVVPIQYK